MGTTWTSLHHHVLDLMPNALWRTATQMRLRIDTWPKGSTCQLPRADAKTGVCGEMCDTSPWHPMQCQHGGAKMRPHRLLQKALARRLQFSGAHVDEERHIPELYDMVWDKTLRKQVPRVALMDVVASFPGLPAPFLIDVSVRSPAAERVATATVIAGKQPRRERRRSGTDMVRWCARWSSRAWAGRACTLARSSTTWSARRRRAEWDRRTPHKLIRQRSKEPSCGERPTTYFELEVVKVRVLGLTTCATRARSTGAERVHGCG